MVAKSESSVAIELQENVSTMNAKLDMGFRLVAFLFLSSICFYFPIHEDSSISKAYGLFVTYPIRQGETLDSVSSAANLSSDLIRSYNLDANFSAVNSLIYIPGRDENGNYPPLKTREIDESISPESRHSIEESAHRGSAFDMYSKTHRFPHL
ncbi:hypothetical protein L1887_01200 [Cichorium endivia]|nr:hypothetical protein L1887_01200 [Cichorium endivia]